MTSLFGNQEHKPIARTVTARFYATGQPVRLSWGQGRITGIEPAPDDRGGLPWVAPALVDLQINGFGGVDFQQDGLTHDPLRLAVRALHAAGCGRFLLTLITDGWERMLDRLRHLRQLRSRSPELERAIAGWHLEGPFLSAEPGYHGAHPPDCMIDPSPRHLRQLREATGSDPVLVTLAPERPGAIESIAEARRLGIRVSLGHTNATPAQLRAALAAGADAFTHLGNACPQLLDRHDNILWRVLDLEGVKVSLIGDGIHVSPPLFRLVHRALGPAAIVYTTDAMAAAGMPPGRYQLGSIEIEVGRDGVVWQPGRSNFAGSALRPIDGVWRVAKMLGCRWPEAWDGWSVRPAAWLGESAVLEPGARADFCLLETDAREELRSVRTFVAGNDASAG